MMRDPLQRSPQRGAVLIHVALALVVLLALSAFAIDLGVMWTSRAQAQTAADAAALAAATSLAFDSDDRGRATAVAQAVGQRNAVWGAAADVQPADVTFPPCPPGALGMPDTCVRVNVFRNQGRNPLPTFFARLVGVGSQGVQAMATAQILSGTQTNCLRPWGVPDKWLERYSPDDEFDLYYPHGSQRGTPLPSPDIYVPPSDPNLYLAPDTQDVGVLHTGYKIPDIGTELILKPGNPNQAPNPGWFFPIDLPRPSGGPMTGGDKYRENIAGCNGQDIGVGDTIQNEPGNMIGPTRQGVDALTAQDPSAQWDDTLNCVTSGDSVCRTSPRIVALPVFDVEEYEMGRARDVAEGVDRSNGRFTLRIVNILGFFIEEMRGNDVYGHLTYYTTTGGGSSELDPDATFLRTVILVR